MITVDFAFLIHNQLSQDFLKHPSVLTAWSEHTERDRPHSVALHQYIMKYQVVIK